MQYQFFLPHPALGDLLKGILVANVDLREVPAEVVCPFPPTPEQYIYFYLNDPIHTQKKEGEGFVKKPGSIIVGPQSTKVSLQMGKMHRMVGIIFRPGGLYRILGVPMNRLLDLDPETDALMGNNINLLREQLQYTENWVDIKQIVENFLFTKLSNAKALLPFDHAIQKLMQSGGLLTIEQAASVSCLSLRQFERLSHQRIGLPPKFFARLVRFSRAYRLRETNEAISWTKIAYHTGYFDQMHLIRDFKEFAGANPLTIEAALRATPLRLQASIRH